MGIGTSLPPPPKNKGGTAPSILACVCCGQTVGWIKMKLGMEVGRPNCVRWGTSFPSPKRGTASQFLAHVCCGQTAGWMKMSLGMEVSLTPGDIVRWGSSSHSLLERGTSPSIFQSMSIVATRSRISVTVELLFCVYFVL